MNQSRVSAVSHAAAMMAVVGVLCSAAFLMSFGYAQAAETGPGRVFDKRVNLKVNKSDGPVFLNTSSEVTVSWAARGVKNCKLSLMSARRADVTFAEIAVKSGNGSQTYQVPGVANHPALLRLVCTAANGKQTLVDEVALNHDWESPNATPASVVGEVTSPVLPVDRAGAVLTMGTASAQLRSASTTGEYTINFEVTAASSDVYVPKTATRSVADSSSGVNFRMENPDNTTANRGRTTATLTSDAQEDSGYYKVLSGQTKRFTLTVAFDPIAAGQYKLQLMRLNWSGAPATPNKSAAPRPANDFETQVLQLSN